MSVATKEFADFVADCDLESQKFLKSIDELARPVIEFDAENDRWIVRCTDSELAKKIWKGRFDTVKRIEQVWIGDKILASNSPQPADCHELQFYSDQLEVLMGSVNNDADHAEKAVCCDLTSELAEKLRELEEAIDRARELALEVELLVDRL